MRFSPTPPERAYSARDSPLLPVTPRCPSRIAAGLRLASRGVKPNFALKGAIEEWLQQHGLTHEDVDQGAEVRLTYCQHAARAPTGVKMPS